MKRHVKRLFARDADQVLTRSDLTVALATLEARIKAKPGKPRLKPKQSPVEFAARFAIEKALQQRRYCNAFALWRTCRNKNCRRQRVCVGDAHVCLQHGLVTVPPEVQTRVRRDILEATPKNIGAPERAARQCMPLDFYKQGGGTR